MRYIVYKITNNINGKVYIGQTTETLKRRCRGMIKKPYLNQFMFEYIA